MGLLHIIFRTFVPVLFPLIYAKISFPFNILKPNGPNFTKLFITFITVKIYVGIVSCHFSQICKRVKALIDVRITLPLNILRNSGLSLHAKHCSWAIVRFSDSSSLICFGAKSMGMFFFKITILNSNSQHQEVVSHYIFKESVNLQIFVLMCISLT